MRLYRKKLEGQELKPLTVTHVLSDFRAFLPWCVDSDKLVQNPWPSDVMPSIQENPP